MIDFIINNWGIISFVLLTLASILNAATNHFSKSKGAVKIMLFLSEMFSIIASKGEVNGRFGKLKLPLQSAKDGKKEPTF